MALTINIDPACDSPQISWESSSVSGGPFTLIPGETTDTLDTVVATDFYRGIVQCGNGCIYIVGGDTGIQPGACDPPPAITITEITILP